MVISKRVVVNVVVAVVMVVVRSDKQTRVLMSVVDDVVVVARLGVIQKYIFQYRLRFSGVNKFVCYINISIQCLDFFNCVGKIL